MRHGVTSGSWRSLRPSPGHQAGAPLRLGEHERGDDADDGASPGHQAGAPLRLNDPSSVLGACCPFPRPSGRGSIAAARPATDETSGFSTSPGHQAGAPLRRRGRRRGTSRRRGLPPAIRPGLHCGDAGSQGWQRALYGFPRPSGRGSIAARSRMAARWGAVPFPRPSGRGSIAAAGRRRHIMPAISTSPGHQAGAPLRRVSPSLRRQRSLRLPPAIRPGLHCGFQCCVVIRTSI